MHAVGRVQEMLHWQVLEDIPVKAESLHFLYRSKKLSGFQRDATGRCRFLTFQRKCAGSAAIHKPAAAGVGVEQDQGPERSGGADWTAGALAWPQPHRPHQRLIQVSLLAPKL